MNNQESPAVLAGWKVALDESGRGQLNAGPVQCRRDSVGYRVGVELMPAGRDLVDAPGALAYALELEEAINERYGPPAVIWAEPHLWGNWAWKVGRAGLGVQADARGVRLSVMPDGDAVLQYLRDAQRIA